MEDTSVNTTSASAGGSRSGRSPLGPQVYGVAVLLMNAAFVIAGLAAIYLLIGLLGGGLAGYSELPRPDRLRILANIDKAGTLLTFGLAAGALLAAYVFVGEQATGYLIGLAAALIGVGVPFLYGQIAGVEGLDKNHGLARALGAFPLSMRVPLFVAGLLIVRDIVLRLVSGVRGEKKVDKRALTYGGEAQKEARPVRLSLMAKCWEGPYCREFIRTHCPIFLSRQACWRVKRGCYCEEDIVSNAAAKVSGVSLEMAPDARYNFANAAVAAPRRVELTMSQKKERCRNCVIYNEHQREKYRLLMPVALLGTLALCALFSPVLRELLGAGLGGLETLMRSLYLGPKDGINISFTRPSPTVEWVLIGALTVMVLSKVLQTLEWAVFKAKI